MSDGANHLYPLAKEVQRDTLLALQRIADALEAIARAWGKDAEGHR